MTRTIASRQTATESPALNTSALREAAGSAGTSRGDLPGQPLTTIATTMTRTIASRQTATESPALNTSALREAAGSAGTSRGDLPAPAALSPTLPPPIRSAGDDDPRPPASRARFSSTERGASFPF